MTRLKPLTPPVYTGLVSKLNQLIENPAVVQLFYYCFLWGPRRKKFYLNRVCEGQTGLSLRSKNIWKHTDDSRCLFSTVKKYFLAHYKTFKRLHKNELWMHIFKAIKDTYFGATNKSFDTSKNLGLLYSMTPKRRFYLHFYRSY